MRSGYVYHCPDCGETTYVALGIGSEYTPLKVFYREDVDRRSSKTSCRTPQYRSAAFLLQNGGIPDTTHPGSYGQKLYYCPHCRTLKVKFFCTILKDGQPWKPTYTCELCGRSMVLAPNQENGDDPSRDQMEGADDDVLSIHCMKCVRIYFAPESGCISKILWD